MKTLRNIFSIIIAGIFGLIPIVGFGIIGFLILTQIEDSWRYLVLIILILIGLYFGYFVFIQIWRRGLIEFLSLSKEHTPELDNLKPTVDSDFRELDTTEYHKEVSDGNKLCPGGYIRIWGDFRSRQLDIYNEISKVKLDMSDVLTIEFTNNNKVTIVNPKTIFESTKYLKILEASEIIWEWVDQDSNERFYINYLVEKRSIKTRTNSEWKSYKIDTILGQPAIFIFNNE